VLGAVRELELTLAELGTPVDPALTLVERGEALRRSLSLDARNLYARASLARYSARAPSARTSDWAWKESARLRRAACRGAGRRQRILAALRPGVGRATLNGR
jgi:hypothetical protein